MSLFQSFVVGVGGLQSQAHKLGVVSDNIANVNTVGYKGGTAQFDSLLHGFFAAGYLAGGVAPGFEQTNHKQGNVQASDANTDLSISGRGFFPVSDSATDGGDIFYTRAGSFRPNQLGNFMNSAGYFLKGWRLDEDGALDTSLDETTVTQATAEAALTTINVEALSLDDIPTTTLALQLNLKASQPARTNNSVAYVGNLTSTQTPVATTQIAFSANLQSSDATYGSFEFRTEQLFHQIQALIPVHKQTVFNAVQDIFPNLTLPGPLLADQATLQDFISDQYGASVSGFQSFLTALQTELSTTHPLKSYDSTPVTYAPLNATANLTSGAVPSSYQKSASMYDSAGVERPVTIRYLKTAASSWAVEISASDISTITPAMGYPAGLLAYGNMTFDSSGNLETIDSSLTDPTTITWTTPSATSSVTFDLGTVGASDGIKESSGSYSTLVRAQPSYDATVSASSMSSGSITPHYTRNITVTDNAGDTHSIDIHFLKISANAWAIELAASPATDLTTATGGVTGQIAYGTASFYGDDTFESRVTHMVNEVFARHESDAHKEDARIAINTVLGSTVISSSDLDNRDLITRNLIDALQVPPYPVAPDALESFLADVQDPSIGLLSTNPLKTYEFPPSPSGGLASLSPSLTNPITVNWASATELNSLQIDWGTLGERDGLQHVSTAYSGTATITENYSPIDSSKNMASGGVTPHFNRVVDIVDSDGNLRSVNFMFLKTGSNLWAVEVAAKNASDVTLPTAQIAYGTVTFNGDGTPATISDTLTDALTIPWSGGATSSLTLDLGTAGAVTGTSGETVFGLKDGLTQLSSNYQVINISQNGSIAGEHATVAIDDEGILTGYYANGSVRRLYKIPLATFINPDRLANLNGNVFDDTDTSGEALYIQPSDQEASTIVSNSLEASNVDLPTEMSNMLIAQRAYQSNSKLITVTDSMLEILSQMAS